MNVQPMTLLSSSNQPQRTVPQYALDAPGLSHLPATSAVSPCCSPSAMPSDDALDSFQTKTFCIDSQCSTHFGRTGCIKGQGSSDCSGRRNMACPSLVMEQSIAWLATDLIAEPIFISDISVSLADSGPPGIKSSRTAWKCE